MFTSKLPMRRIIQMEQRFTHSIRLDSIAQRVIRNTLAIRTLSKLYVRDSSSNTKSNTRVCSTSPRHRIAYKLCRIAPSRVQLYMYAEKNRSARVANRADADLAPGPITPQPNRRLPSTLCDWIDTGHWLTDIASEFVRAFRMFKCVFAMNKQCATQSVEYTSERRPIRMLCKEMR